MRKCKFQFVELRKSEFGEEQMEYINYIKLMKRQIKTLDSRERAYQDNVIRPFLQSVFGDLDIEPVKKQLFFELVLDEI